MAERLPPLSATLHARLGVDVALPVPARLVRHRGLQELALIAAVYATYDISRIFVEGARHSAFDNADALMDLENATGIAVERALNSALSAHTVLAVTADYLYATTHYIVTPIVLVWLWKRHRSSYSRARTVLAVATVLGLIGFTLMPVAPPRMLPGYIDTMARYASYGWWSGDASAPRGVGQWTNEFAAMPSLHVGWALWCACQVIKHARALPTKVLGGLYPVVTSLVVVSTANHYVLDAVAGVVVIGIAAAIVAGLWRVLRPRVIDLTGVPSPRDHAEAAAAEAADTASTTARESVVMPQTPRSSR
jgi:hypothetical protein